MEHSPLADDLLVARHGAMLQGIRPSMTRFITARGPGTAGSSIARLFALLERADGAPPPPVWRPGGLSRRAMQAFHPPHLDLLGCRLRRHVVVEGPGFGFLDVLVDEDSDD